MSRQAVDRYRERRQELLRAWTRAGQELRLEPPVCLGDDVWMKGTRDGFAVELSDLASLPGTRVSVTRGDLAKTLRLRLTADAIIPMGIGSTAPSTLTIGVARPRGLGTGDDGFDRCVRLDGDEALAAALLDHAARRVLLPELLRGLTIGGGVLTRHYMQTAAAQVLIADLITRLTALAGRLVVPEDVAGRLAENACNDPEPGVRVRVLAVLARRFPGRAFPVLRDALHDRDERVRLASAIALGEEGTVELVRLANNEDARDATRVRAIDALGDRLPAADLVSLLRTALERDPEPVVVAAIEGLAKAAEKQGALRDLSVESTLIAALAHAANRVRIAAAVALGRLASLGAVAALTTAIAARAFDFEFDRAARTAVADIQARVSGAERGQLSLAGDGGELSVAGPDASGGVSLAVADDPGQGQEEGT